MHPPPTQELPGKAWQPVDVLIVGPLLLSLPDPDFVFCFYFERRIVYLLLLVIQTRDPICKIQGRMDTEIINFLSL